MVSLLLISPLSPASASFHIRFTNGCELLSTTSMLWGILPNIGFVGLIACISCIRRMNSFLVTIAGSAVSPSSSKRTETLSSPLAAPSTTSRSTPCASSLRLTAAESPLSIRRSTVFASTRIKRVFSSFCSKCPKRCASSCPSISSTSYPLARAAST